MISHSVVRSGLVCGGTTDKTLSVRPSCSSEDENLDKGRLYSYDIGFSFAGETRQIVEAVNSEMKAEDVVTFYDYDQQAFLLALVGIPTTIGRIDLRDIRSQVQKTGMITKESINALRNRCVLPILEKIDTASGTI